MREDKGTPFGKYELLERLGVGGMATVYRARYPAAPGVTKFVVIKRVLNQYAENPDFVEMFINEARISVGLSHGNIVQVFDFGQVNGEYFLAMELVEGQPLSRVLKRAQAQGITQLPQPLAVSIAIEMCKGLHHAHTRTDEQGRPLGVVHRDVSPDNVLVSYDGEVKITDFGIAKAQLAGRPVTLDGMVKGKYLYLSPEQALGDPLDARSDVYAVGVVLYRMLCGRLPVDGGEDVMVMDRIVRGELTPARALNPELDAQLVDILDHALARLREQRFHSAEELQQVLARWMATRAPLFTVGTLKYLMGWLYAQELKVLGRAPSLPEDFLKQVELWKVSARELIRPGVDATAATQPALTVEGLDSSAVETALATPARGSANRSGNVFWWGLGVVAVALLLFAVFLELHHPKPLEVRSEPPGAQVRLDGEVRGVTPVAIEDVARNQPHTVELVLLGYKRWERGFVADTIGDTVEAELEVVELPVPEPPAAAEPDEAAEPPEPSAPTKPSAPVGTGLRVTVASKPSAEAATAKYKQGMKLLARGELKPAREMFWACLANDPKAARCFRQQAEISERMGNKEEAVEFYTRFLEIDPYGEGSKAARAYILKHGQGGR